MNRQLAAQTLRKCLDDNGLSHWHIRLSADLRHAFLGMCSYKDSTIILNAHHCDTHGDLEVINTIRHEVAHALTPGHSHDDVWKECARNIGCDDIAECAHYSFNENAIDAIRSGATVEVTYEERTIREPKYKISKLQDKCVTCGKIAVESRREEVRIKTGRKVIITLQCGHIVIKDADSSSNFEDIVFDGIANCTHTWGTGKSRTTCTKCNAHKLYDFQIEGARFLERANGRGAILDEMGLGKTLQPLAYLKYHKHDAWPFLWVTKSGIKFQHAKEIIRILGHEAFPQIITTGKDTLIDGMNVIASYSIFRRLDLEMFAKHGFKSVIFDECQALKNPDASQTQCARSIARNISKIIPTSGTFWKNRGSEAFVMCNILDPAKFNSHKAFKRDHVETYWHGNREKEGGLRKGFMKEISHLAIRRERKDVMPELPLISRHKFLCEIEKSAAKVYADEETNFIDIYNNAVIGGDEDSFETQKALNASIIIMRQIVGIAKVPAIVELAQDHLEETDRKLIVGIHHLQVGKMLVEQLTSFCAENDMPAPLVLRASMSSEERFAIQESFNGPNHRLLICSTLASGEGINLQTCSDMIVGERQWNPMNEMQLEGRMIRIGQTAQAVTATYVHADGTCDMDLDTIVETKRKFFEDSMNREGSSIAWSDGDMTKALAAKIAAKRK